jgi:hypothetical protein
MQSKATIMSAKVGGSEYGRESTLTLTLDVKLPAPVEIKTLNEWAASELDWNTRQEIAQAQRQRHEAKHPTKLTKAQKKAQQEAHDQGDECAIETCENCHEQQSDEAFTCLAHALPLLECHDCDEESAIFLDPEDATRLRDRYEVYLEEQRRLNQEALAAAHEAALFLLLIKKPVHVSIAPAQQAFADLLQLASPSA